MRAILAWAILGIILSAPAFADDGRIDLTLKQQNATQWLVRYELSRPVQQLILRRPPNNDLSSRTETWRPGGSDIEIVLRDGRDVIRRKDGKYFDEAKFFLAAEYRELEFDYATFLPFSDGSLLIFTGRFTACLESCEARPLTHLEIIPETGRVMMSESGDGYAYVGDGEIEENDDFRFVIDPGLPRPLRQAIATLIPDLMRYFEPRLGALPVPPLLFASLDVSAPEDQDGYEGGTLQGEELYLHFLGSSWREAEPPDLEWVPWFFAHEMAHLFQRYFHPPKNQAWIREGGADAMAALAARDLGFLDEEIIAERVEDALSRCAEALGEVTLSEAAGRGVYWPYYKCGMIMHLAADAALRRASNGERTLFTLWKDFRDAVDTGAPLDQTTMIELVAEHGDRSTADFLETLITEPLDDPKATLRQGLARSGFINK